MLLASRANKGMNDRILLVARAQQSEGRLSGVLSNTMHICVCIKTICLCGSFPSTWDQLSTCGLSECGSLLSTCMNFNVESKA